MTQSSNSENNHELNDGQSPSLAEQLEQLAANSPSAALRQRVAENPNTPVKVLIALAGDEDVDIRIAVAGNHSAPQWVRRKFAQDESPTVRFAVAADPHTPLPILSKLADDEHPYVQHRARRTIDVLELELALAEEDFVAEAGLSHKLGALLVAAQLLNQGQADELVKIATETRIPLGHAIAHMNALPKQTITCALLAQSMVRRKEISESAAIEGLKTNPIQFLCADRSRGKGRKSRRSEKEET